MSSVLFIVVWDDGGCGMPDISVCATREIADAELDGWIDDLEVEEEEIDERKLPEGHYVVRRVNIGEVRGQIERHGVVGESNE